MQHNHKWKKMTQNMVKNYAVEEFVCRGFIMCACMFPNRVRLTSCVSKILQANYANMSYIATFLKIFGIILTCGD